MTLTKAGQPGLTPEEHRARTVAGSRAAGAVRRSATTAVLVAAARDLLARGQWPSKAAVGAAAGKAPLTVRTHWPAVLAALGPLPPALPVAPVSAGARGPLSPEAKARLSAGGRAGQAKGAASRRNDTLAAILAAAQGIRQAGGMVTQAAVAAAAGKAERTVRNHWPEVMATLEAPPR